MDDVLGRPLQSLRISVTDRCNLRCHYCMPGQEYVWLPREDLLSGAELDRLVGVFLSLGVERVRLTGGEPLLRPDLAALVGALARRPGIRDLALTTNGALLAEQAGALRSAGLHRLTVSLDTLRPETFERLTRRAALPSVLDGIEAADRVGFEGTKLDAVLVRGLNDGELEDLLAFARARRLELRFIEYMDVGGAIGWSPGQVVTRAEILARLTDAMGPIERLPRDPPAPAERFRLRDGTIFGIIASVSQPFCRSCDRARLTADGAFYTCLYARTGLNLRVPLRAGASDDALLALLREAWTARVDRGAELRHALGDRGPWATAGDLRADAHLEMHTRGG